MSQRSQRFLAAKEASFLHTALDHRADPPPVPTLRTLVEQDASAGSADGAVTRRESPRPPTDGSAAGVLDAAASRINDLTGKLMQWGRRHPLRLAGAAAALVVVSGLVVGAMRKRAQRVAAAHQTVKQVKTHLTDSVRRGPGRRAHGAQIGKGGRGEGPVRHPRRRPAAAGSSHRPH